SAGSMAGITTSTPAIRFVIDWIGGQSDWLFARIGRIAIIVGAIALVLEFVQTLGESVIAYVKNEDRSSLTENERRASTLVQIVNTSARVVLFCIGGIMILRELGMDITPLLTGAGIVGVAIGFGSQSLVKDFFAGFFILVENQFRVGDVVEIGGRAGAVEKINLKTTVLRANDGSVFIIPNGEITSVKNMTYTWSRAVLDIGVSYDTDLDRAIEILQRVGDELASDTSLAGDIWGRPEVLGVENLDASSVVLRMLVKTRPLTQWQVARVFRMRIKKAFEEEGIEIPFPQRVVTLRIDEDMKNLLRGLGSKDA
ncbi:MAG TPA: mechanosensitive ion channel family protein, partial [Candidatus Ozemobacteraceae bacterium]